MQLSKYFSLEDFTRSSTASSKGIDNTPDTFSQANLQNLAVLLDTIYDNLGPFTVTSGYRASALNSAVGGADGSLHMRGMAADIMPENDSASSYFWKLAASPLRNSCGEIINESADKGVIHVSLPYEGGTGVLKYLQGGQYYRYTSSDLKNKLGASTPAATPDASDTSSDFPSFQLTDIADSVSSSTLIPVVLIGAVLLGGLFLITTGQKKEKAL